MQEARPEIKKKLLWKLRWETVMREKWIWVLLLLAIVIPAVTEMIDGFPKALSNVLNNVSFGYIAGMLFYVMSDFNGRTSRRLEAIQNLAQTYSFCAIQLDDLKLHLWILGRNGGFEDNYLDIARKRIIMRQCTEEDPSKLTFVELNPDALVHLRSCASFISQSINNTLIRSGQDLSSEEQSYLQLLDGLYSRLFIHSRMDFQIGEVVTTASVDVDNYIETLYGLDTMIHKLKAKYLPYVYVKLIGYDW